MVIMLHLKLIGVHHTTCYYINCLNVTLYKINKLLILTHTYTASSSQFSGVSRDQLLLTTGALGLLSGVYLFLSYGLAQSRVRSAMRCREDPLIRSKINHYSNTSQVHACCNVRDKR